MASKTKQVPPKQKQPRSNNNNNRSNKGQPPLTVKQKLLQAGAEQRHKIQQQVFAWQERLFTDSTVSVSTLQEAALWLQPQTYFEIVEERCVQSICGYPLCDHTLTEPSSRYHISLSQRKVFDQSELASFCSTACLQKSKYYVMQLSDDPVWVRDLSSTSTAMRDIHVITLKENFKQAIEQRQQRQHILDKTNYDLRKEYVHQLLANVPLGDNNTINNNQPKETNSIKEVIIMEKAATTAPLNIPFGGAHDAIEGYRIDASTSSQREPTTIVLNTSSPTNPRTTEIVTPTTVTEPLDPLDEASILNEAMETMMMLKKMNLDRDDPTPKKEVEESKATVTSQKQTSPSAQTQAQVQVQTSNDKAPFPNNNENKSEKSSEKHDSFINTHRASEEITKAAVKSIETAAAAAKSAAAKKAKKKKEPEMSLFGKVWTMLDRMTTKSTRLFLASLTANNGNSATEVVLLEEDGLQDDSLLRGHIFSEKILETYGLIRSQLRVKGELEMDLVNLIRTFRFADATMVVLDTTQTYMMTLVLFKTLAPDILMNETDWKDNFESCCSQIDQTSDMVDACVRVLKVAST